MPDRQKPSLRLKPTLDPGVQLRLPSLESLELSGRQVAVIGGTGGLGRALAEQMVQRGATVTVVGRTFRERPSPHLMFVQADLSSMKEAARLGRELPAERLDLVVFTTGIIAAPKREVTADGIERDLAVSYLNRLAILRGLAPRIGTDRPAGAARSRVFVMASPGHGMAGDPDDINAERDYRAMDAHANTIAGNEILVLRAEKQFPGAAFYGLAPGLVKTDIRANWLGAGSLKHRAFETVAGILGPSPRQYARRIVPLMFAPGLENHPGLLFNAKAQPIKPTPDLLDEAHTAAFMAASERLLDAALA